MSEEVEDPRLQVKCRLCRAPAGKKCRNYKGKGKQTCAQRGTPDPTGRVVVIADEQHSAPALFVPVPESAAEVSAIPTEQPQSADAIALATRARQGLTLRSKRIAAANVLRSNGGLVGRAIGNVLVAYRVGGITLGEVQAVREELERNGVLADELDAQAADEERGRG